MDQAVIVLGPIVRIEVSSTKGYREVLCGPFVDGMNACWVRGVGYRVTNDEPPGNLPQTISTGHCGHVECVEYIRRGRYRRFDPHIIEQWELFFDELSGKYFVSGVQRERA